MPVLQYRLFEGSCYYTNHVITNYSLHTFVLKTLIITQILLLRKSCYYANLVITHYCFDILFISYLLSHTLFLFPHTLVQTTQRIRPAEQSHLWRQPTDVHSNSSRSQYNRQKYIRLLNNFQFLDCSCIISNIYKNKPVPIHVTNILR